MHIEKHLLNKEVSQKLLCNILLIMLHKVSPANYYRPLRALKELFLEEATEKDIALRFAYDLLTYKKRRAVMPKSELMRDWHTERFTLQYQAEVYNYEFLYRDTL